MVEKVSLEIHLPAGFPENYRTAVTRAAEQCKVKKHLEKPPALEVHTTIAGGFGPPR
jgi:ribosomal protein S12 methylthiotransferase accessory factor